MKIIFTLLIVLVVNCLSLSAQIPNAGFQNWTANEPNGWITDNSTFPGIVTQSSNAHTGNSAMRINVISFSSFVFPGIAIAGTDPAQPGFPVSSPPVALHGWYVFNSTSANEYFYMDAAVQQQGTGVASAAVYINSNTSVFTEFVADFFYPGSMGVDTGQITFGMGSSDSVRVSTYLIVDDLSYGPASTVGIKEFNEATVFEPCSPNPATQVANIIFRTSGNSKVCATIFDLVGNKMMTLADDTEVPPGRHKIPADVSQLANGIYLCRLSVNGQLYSQKLVVSK